MTAVYLLMFLYILDVVFYNILSLLKQTGVHYTQPKLVYISEVFLICC